MRETTALSMVSSSQDSDFYGFTPTLTTDNVAPCESVEENLEKNPNDHQFEYSARKHQAIRSSECNSAQTITSEEFSDQDIRYKIEMEKDVVKQRAVAHDNENLCNVSHFSIEPNSSDDEEEPNDNNISLNFAEVSNNVHTLSVNENSNNAVDNAISNASYMLETDLKDLSFNGILNPEPALTKDTSVSINESDTSEKENKENLNTSNNKSNLQWQLHMETSRECINERSPDLFSDDDDLENDIDNNKHSVVASVDVNDSFASYKDDEKENVFDNCIEKNEKATSKRIQNLLSGILPPPSVTYIQHDIANLLSLYKKNTGRMESEINNTNDSKQNGAYCDQKLCPLMPKILDNVEWPQIERVTAFGLHYNRTKYTENIEMMYMKLVERNVGQETSSSFTYTQSINAKKKPARKL